MALTEDEERRLRAELVRLAPLLAEADQREQERALDAVFARAGYEPDWALWLAFARLYLPAHRRVAYAPVAPGTSDLPHPTPH